MRSILSYVLINLTVFSPSKPSRPSRAYLRVTAESHVAPLSDKLRAVTFVDAKNTSKDAALLGPPTLEFSPFGRVAGGRSRKDARQGTIDQDAEFIDFLESLTNPVVKPTNDVTGDGDAKEDKITTTPLIQFLKEKKANKAKDNAATSKSAKHGRGDTKESKTEKVQSKKLLSRADKEATPVAQTKSEKAGKETGKASNKQTQNTGKNTPKVIAQSPKTNSPATPVEKKRERGNVSAAAKILQRDLGLAAGGGRRRPAKGAAAESSTQTSDTAKAASQPAIDTGKASATPAKAAPSPKPTQAKTDAKSTLPSGPAPNRQNKRNQKEPQTTAQNRTQSPATASAPTANQSSNAKTSQNASPKPNPTPSAGATQAFLKHANASQGITEPLLETAFTAFGKLSKVEIDKKKGFGYVDFENHESLKKAMAASPVKVAQGQVVVLERKSGTVVAQARGGNKAANGKGNNSTQNAQPAQDSQPTQATQATANTPSSKPSNPPGNRNHRRGGRGRGGKGGNNSDAPASTPTTPTPAAEPKT